MTKKDLAWVLLIIILIVLPTGTPEDLITTIPIINKIGLQSFILLSIGLLLFYSMVKRK